MIPEIHGQQYFTNTRQMRQRRFIGPKFLACGAAACVKSHPYRGGEKGSRIPDKLLPDKHLLLLLPIRRAAHRGVSDKTLRTAPGRG